MTHSHLPFLPKRVFGDVKMTSLFVWILYLPALVQYFNLIGFWWCGLVFKLQNVHTFNNTFIIFIIRLLYLKLSKFIADSHGASSDIIVNIRQDAVESWQRCGNSKKFHQILINYLVQWLKSQIDFVYIASKNFPIH